MNEAANERRALPRILVVNDFALQPKPEPPAERVPKEVRRDNFNAWLKALGVWLEMSVPNVLEPHLSESLSIQLGPKSIAKLSPDAIVAAIPILTEWRNRYLGLRGLKNMVSCIKEFRKFMNEALVQPNLRQQLAKEIAAPVANVVEPASVIGKLLEIAKLEPYPGDDGYERAVHAIRWMLSERLTKGATTLDTCDVISEVDRIADLLAAQVKHIFQDVRFQTLERAWRGLDMLMKYDAFARIDVVTCTMNEFREDATILSTWLQKAQEGEDPYAAVLVAMDVDLFDYSHDVTGEILAEQLADIGEDESTPIFVGYDGGCEPLLPTEFFKPYSGYTPVRPRYGDEDGELHVRDFSFREPGVGPPSAHWPASIAALATLLPHLSCHAFAPGRSHSCAVNPVPAVVPQRDAAPFPRGNSERGTSDQTEDDGSSNA